MLLLNQRVTGTNPIKLIMPCLKKIDLVYCPNFEMFRCTKVGGTGARAIALNSRIKVKVWWNDGTYLSTDLYKDTYRYSWAQSCKENLLLLECKIAIVFMVLPKVANLVNDCKQWLTDNIGNFIVTPTPPTLVIECLKYCHWRVNVVILEYVKMMTIPKLSFRVFKMGHSPWLFLYFCQSAVSIKLVHSKMLPMIGFKLRTSGIRSDCSANWATTNALLN